MGTCSECEETFYVDENTEIGDIVDCAKCETKLEILNVHPVAIDYAAGGDTTPSR